jgi:hypothetical protein
MGPIQIFGAGTASRSVNVTAQERINLYLEQSDDKSTMVAYGTPGLSAFADFGASPVRGMHVIGDTLYAVNLSGFYSVNNSGITALLGNLLTFSGKVSMADNGLQLIIVDGIYGYIYTLATAAFVRITDVDFPGGDTVAFSDSFFIVNKPASQQFYLSASYNGLAWDGLDFASAESSPDNLVAVAVTQGRIVLFGALSIEHWASTGALDFPYSRISSATSDWGLAARFSVAEFNSSLIFLAQGRKGESQVVWLNGYTLERVSTFDIESIINAYPGVADASGFSYLYNGHQFYQLNFTSQGKSWLYDGATSLWSELKTGSGRHESEMATAYLGGIKAASYSTGKIYTVDGNSFTDNGVPIYSTLVTKHVSKSLERVSFSSLQVDCETGNGTSSGQGTAPRMMMQASKDGGHTWGNERWADMGAIGNYKARCRWNRLGLARDWVFRLSISDPVKRAILGAWVSGG